MLSGSTHVIIQHVSSFVRPSLLLTNTVTQDNRLAEDKAPPPKLCTIPDPAIPLLGTKEMVHRYTVVGRIRNLGFGWLV